MDPIPINRLRVAIEARAGWEVREMLNDPAVRQLALQDMDLIQQALQTRDPDVITPFLEAGAIVPNPHRIWLLAYSRRHAPLLNALMRNEEPGLERHLILPMLKVALETGAVEHLDVLLQWAQQMGIPNRDVWRLTTNDGFSDWSPYRLRPDFMRILLDHGSIPSFLALDDLMYVGDEHLPLVREMLEAMNLDPNNENDRRELVNMIEFAGYICQPETIRVLIQAGAPLVTEELEGEQAEEAGDEEPPRWFPEVFPPGAFADYVNCPDGVRVILEEYEKVHGKPYPYIGKIMRGFGNRNVVRVFTFYKNAQPHPPPLQVGFQSYSAGAIALLRASMIVRRTGIPSIGHTAISCILESMRSDWFEQ